MSRKNFFYKCIMFLLSIIFFSGCDFQSGPLTKSTSTIISVCLGATKSYNLSGNQPVTLVVNTNDSCNQNASNLKTDLNAVTPKGAAKTNLTAQALPHWESSNPTCASINPTEGYRTTLSTNSTTPCNTTITVKFNDQESILNFSIDPVPLVSISVTPTNPSIALGYTQQFTAIGTYSDNTTRDLTTSVTWTSSQTSIATISNATNLNGRATSVGIGTTTITATDTMSGIAGSTSFNVTPAVLLAVSVTPTNSHIASGSTQQFTATGLYSDNSTQDLTTAVTWTSSQTNIASISDTAGSKGLATSMSAGATTITATDVASGIAGSTDFTVTSATLVSIAVTPTNSSVAIGSMQQFTAIGTYSDNSTQDLTTAVTWSSSQPAKATISNAAGSKGLATSVSAGTTTITATHTASGITSNTSFTVTSAVLVSISVTPTNPRVALGSTQQFTATGTYSDNSTQDLTTAVTWTSSQTNIATISNANGSKGLGTSVSSGTTTITATHAASGITGSTNFTVTSAVLVSISVTPTNPSIALGYTQQFTATGIYSDNTVQDLTTAVTWLSSQTSVATISNASGSRGLATSVGVGTTIITAIHAGSQITGSTNFTVTSAVLASISVTPPNSSIALGYTQQFTATGIYSNNTIQDLTSAVTWTSSQTNIAVISNTVGSQGLATSVSNGTTTITATHTASGITGSTNFTVTPAVLVSISITPTNPSIALGYTQQFTATGTYSDNSTHDLTTAVTLNSSQMSIATISNAASSRGLAASVGIGTTTITASHAASGITNSTDFTVTPAVLASISITPTNSSIAFGYTQHFTATGIYSDNTTQDLTKAVTWSSSQTSIASISNAAGSQGLATSVGVGTTIITAIHAASNITGSTNFTVTPAVLVSISVTPTNPSIALGYTQLFAATGIYSDNTTQDLTTAVTWTSSHTSVATISNAVGSKGRATTVSSGLTTITAIDPTSGISGSSDFTVSSAVLVSIAVTPSNSSIALGYTQQFTATGTYSDSSTQDLTTAVTWSSSQESIATISNAGSKGLATSVGVGTTVITATHAASGISGNTNLTVTAAVLVSIAVTPSNSSIALGYTQQFTAIGTYSNSSTQDLTTAVTWSSSQIGIATINNASSKGLATSVGVGTTVITATHAASGISGNTNFTVTSAVLVSIAVTPNDNPVQIQLNKTKQFTATGTYSDSSTQILTNTVTWSSAASGVISISNNPGTKGLATGKLINQSSNIRATLGSIQSPFVLAHVTL